MIMLWIVGGLAALCGLSHMIMLLLIEEANCSYQNSRLPQSFNYLWIYHIAIDLMIC